MECASAKWRLRRLWRATAVRLVVLTLVLFALLLLGRALLLEWRSVSPESRPVEPKTVPIDPLDSSLLDVLLERERSVLDCRVTLRDAEADGAVADAERALVENRCEGQRLDWDR